MAVLRLYERPYELSVAFGRHGAQNCVRHPGGMASAPIGQPSLPIATGRPPRTAASEGTMEPESRFSPAREMYDASRMPATVVIQRAPVVPSTMPGMLDVSPAAGDARAASAYHTTRVIYLILSIIEILLGLRVALKLLAANPNAGFSRLIDALTTPLVLLFRGVFPDTQGHRVVLEMTTLLALVIYPVAAWVAVRIILIAQRQDAVARVR